jgi:peptidoglycan/xylan/chitin deacetylase (PgdA/CDA1 family)
MGKGKFVISLDFEIYWGIRDVISLNDYKKNLLGIREAMPFLLHLFKQYNINATFATVGFLFFQDKKELCKNLPQEKPHYFNSNLSPYYHVQSIGKNEKEDPFHFGTSTIDQVIAAGQEIGSHSFSHFYCLEKGASLQAFKEDLSAAIQIASKKKIELKSFVFPRNQYNEDYINICKEMGFTSFRGNEKSWLFSSETRGPFMIFRRPFRLLDSYINLSGHNCYSFDYMKRSPILNISSSRFLRPFSKRLKAIEKLRLKRITDSMSFAAKKGLVYHLWWHPHNFGINQSENFSFLENILKHYKKLNTEFDFESVSMQQLANEII